jgi:alginate O-acetyltransferase complex protein AlgJ
MVAAPQHPTSRVANVALVVLFLGAISLPSAVQLLGIETVHLAENRVRAARPALKFERAALAEFPARFEAYYNDSFGLRDRLILWNNLVKVRGLGVSSSPLVLIGEKGWLYFTADGSLEDYRRSRPFTAADLEEWRTALEAKRDWLASRGIRYLVVVAPNKHTIYPEYMPRTVTQVQDESRLDQLCAYLNGRSDVPVLDLREPLLKAKGGRRLYFRRDTHWNGRGAFIGYQSIMGVIERWFPGVRTMPVTAFKEVRAPLANPDLSLLLGLGDILTESDFHLEPKAGRKARWIDPGAQAENARRVKKAIPWAFERDDKGLPRAVVFGDSFYGHMAGLLAEHFSRSLVIWHTPFDTSIVEQERPQVVIEEFVERKLFTPPPLPAELAARTKKDLPAKPAPAIASSRDGHSPGLQAR